MTHGGFLAWQGVGGEPYSNCADRNGILDMRSISSYLFVACLFLVESSPSSAAVPPQSIGMLPTRSFNQSVSEWLQVQEIRTIYEMLITLERKSL